MSSELKRKRPAVVDYSGDTAEVVISGKKRARSDKDAERDAYLKGSANHVLAAAAGKFSTGREAGSGSYSKRARREDGDREAKPFDLSKVDFNEVFRSVHSFGASAFTGKEKKIFEMKQLNALGANLKHKEKMPLKMWMGVSKARKDRAEKKASEEKAAGIVTGRKIDHLEDKKGRRFHGGGGDLGDDGDGGVSHGRNPRNLDSFNMRGPVMYVKGGPGGGGGGNRSDGGGRGGSFRGRGGGRGGGGRGGFGGGRGRGGGGGRGSSRGRR